ncbi:MAG: aminomethyltransferase family protein [Ardenticatenaceae bacterium]|nr:aminomethyltransferase family protein [Ardenticatenaceae bacterium]
MAERRTPLYDIHLRSAVRMVKGGGDYMFPLSYTSPMEEHLNTRTNIGMQDISSMGEVDVKGPGAERLLHRLCVANIRNLHPGQVRYTTMCDSDGFIIDDITVYKFNDEHFMVVTSSGPRSDTTTWIRDHAVGSTTYVTDMGGAISLISVQGPRSLDYFKTVVNEVDPETIKFFRFKEAKINGTGLLMSRTGYTGELGFELYCPSEEAGSLWEFIERTAKDFGLHPYGVSAMQSLRIEKAFPLAGPDIDGTQTPFHVGHLHKYINFKKREFIGREALLAWQDRGLDFRWVGLHLESDIPARNGDKIYSIADISSFKEKIFTGSEAGDALDQEKMGLAEIGTMTSSAKGHSVKKMLGLAYVSVTHSYPGARVMVDISGRPTLATIVDIPFFDPAGTRLRAKGPRKVANG